MDSGEEFMIGGCPNKSTYSATLPTPTWNDLLNLLKAEKINRCAILFCGKAGSDGQIGGTGFGKTTRKDVENVLSRFSVQFWDVNAVPFVKLVDVVKATGDDSTHTAELARILLGLNVTPTHVTGIVVRKL